MNIIPETVYTVWIGEGIDASMLAVFSDRFKAEDYEKKLKANVWGWLYSGDLIEIVPMKMDWETPWPGKV